MNNHPYIIGQDYIVKTSERFYIGRLKYVFEGEIVLDSSSSCASHLYECALKDWYLDNDYFYYTHDLIISRKIIIEATKWKNPLPRNENEVD
jgi:hypothetical protein